MDPERRRIVKALFTIPVVLATGGLLAGCEADEKKREEEFYEEQGRIFDEILRETGMEIIDSMKLSSGPEVTIYSDGKLDLDKAAVDKTLNSWSLVLDRLQNNWYKRALKEAQEKAERGEFDDRRIFLAISSKQNTCLRTDQKIREDLLAVKEITSPEDIGECTSGARTTGRTLIKGNNQIMPVKLLVIQATAKVFKGIAYIGLGNRGVRLTPEQSLTFILGHEAVHAFLRMSGTEQHKTYEESFVQSVDRERFSYFEKNPSERPVPVRY